MAKPLQFRLKITNANVSSVALQTMEDTANAKKILKNPAFLFLLIGSLRFLWNLAFGIWRLNLQAALVPRHPSLDEGW
ncbi:MAG TPA: hypothetical protein VNU49_02910 [Opitutaceae bacterium]|jgi:hypothetical protein|nr:hypothetical protein [Opitutaceae bacterium]